MEWVSSRANQKPCSMHGERRHSCWRSCRGCLSDVSAGTGGRRVGGGCGGGTGTGSRGSRRRWRWSVGRRGGYGAWGRWGASQPRHGRAPPTFRGRRRDWGRCGARGSSGSGRGCARGDVSGTGTDPTWQGEGRRVLLNTATMAASSVDALVVAVVAPARENRRLRDDLAAHAADILARSVRPPARPSPRSPPTATSAARASPTPHTSPPSSSDIVSTRAPLSPRSPLHSPPPPLPRRRLSPLHTPPRPPPRPGPSVHPLRAPLTPLPARPCPQTRGPPLPLRPRILPAPPPRPLPRHPPAQAPLRRPKPSGPRPSP